MIAAFIQSRRKSEIRAPDDKNDYERARKLMQQKLETSPLIVFGNRVGTTAPSPSRRLPRG